MYKMKWLVVVALLVIRIPFPSDVVWHAILVTSDPSSDLR